MIRVKNVPRLRFIGRELDCEREGHVSRLDLDVEWRDERTPLHRSRMVRWTAEFGFGPVRVPTKPVNFRKI
jgi:hypothetical protein